MANIDRKVLETCFERFDKIDVCEPPRDNWDDDARCRLLKISIKMFYAPAAGEPVEMSNPQRIAWLRTEICGKCPVIVDCLRSAAQFEYENSCEDLFGFQAGMHPYERRHLYARQGRVRPGGRPKKKEKDE